MHHPIFGSQPDFVFNPLSRGVAYGRAVSKAYGEWSKANPDHSREAGKAEYAAISDRVANSYPTAKERGICPF